jgi:hypothetical protein
MQNNSELGRPRIGRLDALKELQLQENGITSRLCVFDPVKHASGDVLHVAPAFLRPHVENMSR